MRIYLFILLLSPLFTLTSTVEGTPGEKKRKTMTSQGGISKRSKNFAQTISRCHGRLARLRLYIKKPEIIPQDFNLLEEVEDIQDELPVAQNTELLLKAQLDKAAGDIYAKGITTYRNHRRAFVAYRLARGKVNTLFRDEDLPVETGEKATFLFQEIHFAKAKVLIQREEYKMAKTHLDKVMAYNVAYETPEALLNRTMAIYQLNLLYFNGHLTDRSPNEITEIFTILADSTLLPFKEKVTAFLCAAHMCVMKRADLHPIEKVKTQLILMQKLDGYTDLQRANASNLLAKILIDEDHLSEAYFYLTQTIDSYEIPKEHNALFNAHYLRTQIAQHDHDDVDAYKASLHFILNYKDADINCRMFAYQELENIRSK